MITVKQYASERGVTHQAVYGLIKSHKQELEGLIVIQGRTRFLTDDAVELLDSFRKSNPVVVLQMDKDEEIERLNNENKALLLKIAELQEALLNEKDQVKELQQEKIELLEGKKQKAGIWSKIFG